MGLMIHETRTATDPRLQGCGDHRPMMLKDFLRNDRSAAARIAPTKPAIVLLRSRSRRAAANTISAIQRVISAVKSFPFERRSGGPRKLIADGVDGSAALGAAVRVKIKDILRWRSFRDLEDEASTPFDPALSPNRTATASSCTSGSGASCSWCDSNFTAEEEDRDDVVLDKKSFTGQAKNPAEDWSYDESDQQSPVSVLYSPFRQITLANAERAKCVLTARMGQENVCNRTTDTSENPNFEFGEEEVEAERLLARLSLDCELTHMENDLILDEMANVEGDQLLRIARSWIHGEHEEAYEWEVEDQMKACVRDMEKGVSWSRFGEEDEEVCQELEELLLDDLLNDFLA